MLNSFAGTAAPRAGVKFRSSSHDPVTATWFKSIGIRHSHFEGVILVAADPGFDGVEVDLFAHALKHPGLHAVGAFLMLKYIEPMVPGCVVIEGAGVLKRF